VDGDFVVRTERAPDALVMLVVESLGKRVGSLQVQRRSDDAAQVTWRFEPSHTGGGIPHRAVRLAVDHCFTDLGLHRVEALIPVGDTARLRVAARAGLRREGVARGAGGPHTDLVRVARLADDPSPDTRDGFIGVLNANLPTKRVISQGVLRDENDRVLLCELTYKAEWDLPGGVIDPWESPATAVARELHEELGLELSVLGLLVVNWMPPWRGWDDACQFVFDLGRHESSIVDAMTFEATEIVAVHWCTREQARPRVPDYLDTLLGRLERLADPPLYLEGGTPIP
jgi:8-oxo-dGTP pyrophosphatase MutT (NUDIX family)